MFQYTINFLPYRNPNSVLSTYEDDSSRSSNPKEITNWFQLKTLQIPDNTSFIEITDNSTKKSAELIPYGIISTFETLPSKIKKKLKKNSWNLYGTFLLCNCEDIFRIEEFHIPGYDFIPKPEQMLLRRDSKISCEKEFKPIEYIPFNDWFELEKNMETIKALLKDPTNKFYYVYENLLGKTVKKELFFQRTVENYSIYGRDFL